MSEVLIFTPVIFDDFTLMKILKILTSNGHKFTTTSTKLDVRPERGTGKYRVEKLISDAGVCHDGLIINSGVPDVMEPVWFNRHLLDLVVKFNNKCKPILTLSTAAPLVRHIAFIKKISAYPAKKIVWLLETHGCIVSSQSVSVDGNIISSKGRNNIDELMEAFMKQLGKRNATIRQPAEES